jgi:outer membrane protein assembly factor BamB
LDAKDGKVIWGRNIVQDDGVKPPTFGGLAGSPLVMGGTLFLNASSGGMALDARTGKTLWKSGVGSGGHASPVPLRIGQKTYLAIHSPRMLTIVDAADGKEFWSTERRQPIGVNAPDPVVDGTKVFVTAGRATTRREPGAPPPRCDAWIGRPVRSSGRSRSSGSTG